MDTEDMVDNKADTATSPIDDDDDDVADSSCRTSTTLVKTSVELALPLRRCHRLVGVDPNCSENVLLANAAAAAVG